MIIVFLKHSAYICYILQFNALRGQVDGSVVKSTLLLLQRTLIQFLPSMSYGSLPLLIPARGLMPSSGLQRHCTYTIPGSQELPFTASSSSGPHRGTKPVSGGQTESHKPLFAFNYSNIKRTLFSQF